ncbi:MAG: TetR/AcrR family transcriptional regulator [Kineosporiaceae bacterium]
MPPGRRSGPSRAEAGELTRLELLAAGAQLLREQPVGAVFNQVTATEVARRAGRTIGAFYHHWHDQDSYRRELLAYVLAPERVPAEETAEAVAGSLEERLPADEVIRRNARANLVLGMHHPAFALSIAMWAQARSDDAVRGLLRRQYQDVTDTLVPMYAALLETYGWAPRPPFTVELIAVMTRALAEGLVLRAVVDPAAVPLALPDERGRPTTSGAGPVAGSPGSPGLPGPADDGAWDLFGIGMLALLPVVTMPARARPADTGSPAAALASHADARDVVRTIWAAWAEAAEAGPDPGPGG